MIHAKQRRDIQTRVAAWPPSDRGSDDKAVVRSTSGALVAEATEQEFYSALQFFVGEPKRSHNTLRNAPFAAAVAADFLFEKAIQCPLDAVKEILRKQEAHFVRIGSFHRCIKSARPELMTWRGRSFVMENSAAAELVLSKDGGIQRNLIPMGEGVT